MYREQLTTEINTEVLIFFINVIYLNKYCFIYINYNQVNQNQKNINNFN